MGFCKCLKRVPYATITWTAIAVFGAALALCAFNGVNPSDSAFKIDEDIHKVAIGSWTTWVVTSFLALDLLILFVSFFTTGATREACCKGHGFFKKFALLIMYTLFAVAFLVTLGLIVCFFYSTKAQTLGQMAKAANDADVLADIQNQLEAKRIIAHGASDHAKDIVDIVMSFTTEKVYETEMNTSIFNARDEDFCIVDEDGNEMYWDEDKEELTNEKPAKFVKFFKDAAKEGKNALVDGTKYTWKGIKTAKHELVNYLKALEENGSLKWLFYGILCLLFAHICLSITLRGNSIKAKDEEKTATSASYGHGQIDV